MIVRLFQIVLLLAKQLDKTFESKATTSLFIICFHFFIVAMNVGCEDEVRLEAIEKKERKRKKN